MATPQHPSMQGTPPSLSPPPPPPPSPCPGQRVLTTVAALSWSARFFRARFQAGRRLSRREERNTRRFSIPLAMIYVTRRVAISRDAISVQRSFNAADARYKSPGIIIIIIIIIILIIIIIIIAADAYLASISLVLAVMPT